MTSSKRLITVCSILVLLLIALTTPDQALGQLTIPTRTPTPEPDQPPPQPTDDDNGGDKPQATAEPSPTDEPFPQPSPTTAPPPTAVPATVAPFETQLSQAAPCGTPPTFTAANDAAIYAGPDVGLARIATLGAGQVRPIAGRAAASAWWLIRLDAAGLTGWVSDESGLVHGDTRQVPIIAAPEAGASQSTAAGAAWAPTPDARCFAEETLSIRLVWLPNPFFPFITFQVTGANELRRPLLAQYQLDLIHDVQP